MHELDQYIEQAKAALLGSINLREAYKAGHLTAYRGYNFRKVPQLESIAKCEVWIEQESSVLDTYLRAKSGVPIQ